MTPLHQLGDWIRNLLLGIPMPGVRGLFVGSLIALLVWVWRLPRAAVEPPAGARRWDENLKFGASLALIIQIVIYWVF
ncbi:MAG: hypothetical protein KDA60_07625 [Planctomycetales bacterium]|nr:hypothetical protein [Planctomycetales bacterium]